jgi:hypothetical protein
MCYDNTYAAVPTASLARLCCWRGESTAMDDTTEQIEIKRLRALERQAALYGPQTEPSILIEIQELKHRNRASSGLSRREMVGGLDYDFLMNVVAAALVRLGAVESSLRNNDKSRLVRQIIHDIWMIAITVVVVLTLLLQLSGH